MSAAAPELNRAANRSTTKMAYTTASGAAQFLGTNLAAKLQLQQTDLDKYGINGNTRNNVAAIGRAGAPSETSRAVRVRGRGSASGTLAARIESMRGIAGGGSTERAGGEPVLAGCTDSSGDPGYEAFSPVMRR